MQSHTLLSFRKRLKNRGYSDIHIKRVKNSDGKELYSCSAIEPLSGTRVTTVRSVIGFNSLMR